MLVPADDAQVLPVLDGKPIPVITAGEWANIPEPWLQNVHRGGSPIVINPEVLLLSLKKLLGQLEVDLRERADEVPALAESLSSTYQRAKQAERTAQPFETWREEFTDAGGGRVGSRLRVRPVRRRQRLDRHTTPRGCPDLNLARAKDQRTLYFSAAPHRQRPRVPLTTTFRKLEALPAAAPLFDERHNPLWAFGVSR